MKDLVTDPDRPALAGQTAQVDAAEFRTAVKLVAQACEHRSSIAILGHILLEARRDKLVLTATDLDVRIAVTIAAQTGRPFKTTLNSRTLGQLLAGADSVVTLTKDKDLLTIDAAPVTAMFRDVCPAEDFPEPVSATDLTNVEIPEGTLQAALQACRPCISTEPTRYYLNGIYLHDTGAGLIAVATDGHRLARYESGAQWGIEPVILPTPTVDILRGRLRAGGNASIKVSQSVTARHVVFHGDDWTLTSKVIDATYPDYMRVIPPEDTTFDVTLSASALRRLPKLGREAAEIAPEAGKITVKAQSQNLTLQLPISGKGKPTGFNLGYLRGFAIAAGTIRVTGPGPGHPHRILTEDPKLLQVLMPMRV